MVEEMVLRKSAVSVLLGLCALLALACRPAASAGPFASAPRMSVRGMELLADGQPVRGMCVLWHVADFKPSQEKAIRTELAKMKRLGFSGVAIEVGWSSICPKDGVYDFKAPGTDLFLQWAAREGLWVQLLLTPHYAPDWALKKYGDVRMRDADGKPTALTFLPFSPYSPLVKDLCAFQKAVVQHYCKQPNLQVIWLSNEVDFGHTWADRSKWGRAAWQDWLRRTNGDISFWNKRWGAGYTSFGAVLVPAPGQEGQFWQDWLRFRRLSLISFWNRLYANAASARSRFVPLGHKFVFYNSLDAFARQGAFHPSSTRLKMDVLGCDVYGSDSATLALQLSFGKPILIAETNQQRTPDTLTGKADIMRMLLKQQFMGASVQTMYAWNTFNEKTFPWGLRDPDGSLRAGGWGAAETARLVQSLGLSSPRIPAYAAVVIPSNALSAHSDQCAQFQQKLKLLVSSLLQDGVRVHLLLSDDVSPQSYLEPAADQPSAKSLAGYRLIIVPDDLGEDQAFLDSPELAKWVRDGGTLVMGARRNGPPAWTGTAYDRHVDSGKVDTTASGSWFAYTERPEEDFWTLRLSGGEPVAGLVAMASVKDTGEPAMLGRTLGSGRVVCAGFRLFDGSRASMDTLLLRDVMTVDGAIPMTSTRGPECCRLGSTLLLTSDTDWTGVVSLPGAVESVTQYDRDGRVMKQAVLKPSDRCTLMGDLLNGQFALVRLKP